MKTNNKLHSVALASTVMILFLILISSAASATNYQGASPTITETRITTSGSAENPAIYGDRIVWEDDRNGNLDVYMYNLSTKKETRITNNEYPQWDAKVYGSRIVWEDQHDRYSDWNLYMYDLFTHNITQITTSGSAQEPAIYGDKIVWDENNEGWQQIHMYNLSTHHETQITSDESNKYHPKIYGDKIVWDDFGDIYMYDISTSKKTQITTHEFLESGQAQPDIYNNKIVWLNNDNGNVYMYNISTRNITQITASGLANLPDIYGDRIVWQDYRNGKYPNIYDIYMYNLSTEEETRITTSRAAKYPDIYGNRVVWQDNRSGNWDIYMCTFGSSIPVANFTSNVTSGKAPLNVSFTDNSTGSPTTWKWTFGDGTNATTKNPTHNYSKAGNYTVALTVSNAAGNNTTTKTNYIKVTATTTKPVANFTSNVTSGKVPLNVSFTDKSTGTPTKWKWTFGDGTNSTVKNPTHKYSKAGNYTVALTVSNAAGNNTTTKTNYIKVTATTIKPVANFTSNVTSGNVPLTVAFTDKSTGSPTAWKWTFGDGTNSTAKNTTHRYSKAGNYTVSLTVSNSAGSNTTTKTNYIKVKAVTKPVAAFSGSPTYGNAPLNVSFTDKSTGTPTKWKWTFGDGTNSTVKNPAHKYSKAGNYTVVLTATNTAGSNTTTKTNYVKVK